MTVSVVKTAAWADVAEILDFLEAKAGPATALKYARLFDSLLERVAASPETGAPRPKLGAGTRIFVASPYILFYAYDAVADEATVLRILHSRRNITQDLLRQQS
jgi:toxin ParE1/3/4